MKKTHLSSVGAIKQGEDAVARCERLINLARSGQASTVEVEAREWRGNALRGGQVREAGLACHALATSLLLQSRNAEALALFVDAAQAAREAGDVDRHVRTLVQSASALSDMGAQHRALELLSDASHLADSRVSDRARYGMHAVRANIAYAVRDYTQALAHAGTAQSYADREASPLSSLINHWHIGDILFAQAAEAWRRNAPDSSEQLAAAAWHAQLTALDAAALSAGRVAAICYAIIGFVAAWTGDIAFARSVYQWHLDTPELQQSVDCRFRFACVDIALRIAETGIDVDEIDTLKNAYLDVALIERFAGIRLLGDIARKYDQADVAASAFEATLALHDELAHEFGVGLIGVARLRDDLEALQATTQSAMAELTTERRGRQNLEARVLHLQHETVLDPLTSLTNRRGLEALFASFNSEPGLVPMTLAFIDFDYFKGINDQFGHAAGDRSLVALSEAMRAVVREGDCIARYAGDEFVIVFRGAGIDIAHAACARLMTRLAATPVAVFGGEDDMRAPTVSIGIAGRRLGESMESLLQRADHALYAAKTAGRARIEVDIAAD